MDGDEKFHLHNLCNSSIYGNENIMYNKKIIYIPLRSIDFSCFSATTEKMFGIFPVFTMGSGKK